VFKFIRTRKMPSTRQILAIWAGLVALQVVGVGGYVYYVYSTKRVHDAIADGDTERMNELLDRDPSRLNRRSHYGYTPLLEAARWGRTEAINELVLRGADLQATYRSPYDLHEGNALHITAYFGHTEATVALIRAGVDLNARTERGHTPLDVARSRGHREVADVLLAAGAVGAVLW
jgi:ankyrin repeat protein